MQNTIAEHCSALISGASGHIGQAVARHFIAHSADTVLLTCRSALHLHATQAGLEAWGCGMAAEQVRGCAVDLNGVDAMARLSEWLTTCQARPTTLICAHGIAARHDSAQMDVWDFQDVLWLNLTICLQLAQICFPFMAEAHWGRIVFISSIHGTQTYPQRAAYAASKGGLEAMARVLALEWAHLGITVNCVAPGQLDTPMHGSPLQPADLEPVRAATPTGALTTAAQVASLVGWLCSDGAANVTGQVIRMDGGIGIDASRGEHV